MAQAASLLHQMEIRYLGCLQQNHYCAGNFAPTQTEFEYCSYALQQICNTVPELMFSTSFWTFFQVFGTASITPSIKILSRETKIPSYLRNQAVTLFQATCSAESKANLGTRALQPSPQPNLLRTTAAI